jgi:5-methylcytosine-specific restriction endonuclease McrA
MSKGGYRPNSGRKKGSKAWNKGVPMTEIAKARVSASKMGKSSWNKGLKMSDEARKNMSIARIGKKLWPNGRVFSLETREKMSLAKLGKPSKRKNFSFSKESKEKISHSLTGKKHSQEHRDKNRIGQYARHKKNNPDYVPDGWLDLRKKKLKVAGGHHSRTEWGTLKEKYSFSCPCCLRKEPEIKLTRDHIVPVSKGGNNDIGNIQPLCRSCNSRKQTNSIRY